MGRPQDATLGRSQDVIFKHPEGVGRNVSSVTWRTYGDVHRTSFGDFFRASSGLNFAEWVGNYMNNNYTNVT